MSCYHLTSFAAVKYWYDSTKPIRGRKEDVRPIGDRKRTHERIVKVDENTYALLDGDYDVVHHHYARNQTNFDHDVSFKYTIEMCPILWTIDEQGNEFVRVRNVRHGHIVTTRGKFLDTYLPKGVSFKMDRNGHHWLQVQVDRIKTENAYLPKTSHGFDWTNMRPTGADDGAFVTLRRTGDGTYEQVGKKFTMPIMRVDKDKKAELKPFIDKLYEYATTFAPMLSTNHAALSEYRMQFAEHYKYSTEVPAGLIAQFANGWVPMPAQLQFLQAVAEEIIRDEDHPMRVAFTAIVAHNTGMKQEVERKFTYVDMPGDRWTREYTETEDEAVKRIRKEIRSKYNYFMNKVLNLNQTK